MDSNTKGWANRCLPLRIANQNGWVILNDAEFEVIWSGSRDLSGVKFLNKGRRSAFATSMFGYGVVTWTIPFLFRTPPGFDLIVRGVPNHPKDGIYALEGQVEADWLPLPSPSIGSLRGG